MKMLSISVALLGTSTSLVTSSTRVFAYEE